MRDRQRLRRTYKIARLSASSGEEEDDVAAAATSEFILRERLALLKVRWRSERQSRSNECEKRELHGDGGGLLEKALLSWPVVEAVIDCR